MNGLNCYGQQNGHLNNGNGTCTYSEKILVHCRGGRYTEDDAKAIVVQILSVVSFCHLQGVVHRDLKPEV